MDVLCCLRGKLCEAILTKGGKTHTNHTGNAAWQFAAKDGSAALLNVVVVAPKANPYPIHVWLKGLEPEGMYRQTETGDIYSGAALMYGGYTLWKPF